MFLKLYDDTALKNALIISEITRFLEKIGNENVTVIFLRKFCFWTIFTNTFGVKLEIHMWVQEYFYMKYPLLFFDFNKIWHVLTNFSVKLACVRNTYIAKLLYHIISYLIISYHIISYHIISYHIISYHLFSFRGSIQDYKIHLDKEIVAVLLHNCMLSSHLHYCHFKFRNNGNQ